MTAEGMLLLVLGGPAVHGDNDALRLSLLLRQREFQALPECSEILLVTFLRIILQLLLLKLVVIFRWTL